MKKQKAPIKTVGIVVRTKDWESIAGWATLDRETQDAIREREANIRTAQQVQKIGEINEVVAAYQLELLVAGKKIKERDVFLKVYENRTTRRNINRKRKYMRDLPPQHRRRLMDIEPTLIRESKRLASIAFGEFIGAYRGVKGLPASDEELIKEVEERIIEGRKARRRGVTEPKDKEEIQRDIARAINNYLRKIKSSSERRKSLIQVVGWVMDQQDIDALHCEQIAPPDGTFDGPGRKRIHPVKEAA